jgi:hypothetical protein
MPLHMKRFEKLIRTQVLVFRAWIVLYWWRDTVRYDRESRCALHLGKARISPIKSSVVRGWAGPSKDELHGANSDLQCCAVHRSTLHDVPLFFLSYSPSGELGNEDGEFP